MSKETEFWIGLETMASGLGLMVDWEWAFGSAFEWIRPFLRMTEKRSLLALLAVLALVLLGSYLVLAQEDDQVRPQGRPPAPQHRRVAPRGDYLLNAID